MLEITMKTNESITFEEGCNLYLQNCKERNLRDDTIRHYSQSYLRFYKHFDRDIPLSEMNEQKYKEYVLRLREEIENDVSINSDLKDLIATMRYKPVVAKNKKSSPGALDAFKRLNYILF